MDEEHYKESTIATAVDEFKGFLFIFCKCTNDGMEFLVTWFGMYQYEWFQNVSLVLTQY